MKNTCRLVLSFAYRFTLRKEAPVFRIGVFRAMEKHVEIERFRNMPQFRYNLVWCRVHDPICDLAMRSLDHSFLKNHVFL